MNALVTGAAGFIGSFLVETLLKKGWRVTCVVRKTSNLRWIEHLDLQYLLCDLADIRSCSDRLGDFDYIFHAAGLTKATSEHDFFSANAECTKRLLEALPETGRLRRFVFLSSLAAVGPATGGVPVREDQEPRPVSFYGKSKLEGENAVLAHRGRIPVTVIRPPAVYGPRDTDFLLLFRMAKKGLFPYWGSGCYSLLYVEDLVQGLVTAAEKREAEGKTFFLSDGMVYTNDDICAGIEAALGAKVTKIRLPMPLMPFLAFMGEKFGKRSIINQDKVRELRHFNWTCDAGKADNELDFRAKTTLKEGIKWTADWYRIHRWL